MTAIRKIVSLTGKYLHMEVPDEFKDKKVEVIIFPVSILQENRKEKKIYDFSDVAGKMKWSGDAVLEQRRIRDEW